MDEWVDRVGRYPAGLPGGTKRHAESRFGFSLEVPGRFVPWTGTLDPVAVLMRPEDADRSCGDPPPWPLGFRDPAVVAPDTGGVPHIARFLEFDVLLRPEPLDEDEFAGMWYEARGVLPSVLAGARIPEFRLLDVRETTLGPLPALVFEWCSGPLWGLTGAADHALLVWALHPQRVCHVYHHCREDRWDEHLSELEGILASFELLDIAAERGTA